MATRKHGLGRGLDALLSTQSAATTNEEALQNLPIETIVPGKYQPRRHWNQQALDELAESIKAQGLIQPIVVRQKETGEYELIAGERRWRAAQKAQLDTIPAIIKQVEEQAVPAMALIENIQRSDLTTLEEADALKRLIDDFELTHQQAAQAVGRSRATVSNLLRLLDLAKPIRQLLDEGKLEMGHARCLLTLPEDVAVPLARQCVMMGWSVRQLEKSARRTQNPPSGEPTESPVPDADTKALETHLCDHFAARIQLLSGQGGRGKLVFHYHSLDELDGLLEKMHYQKSED